MKTDVRWTERGAEVGPLVVGGREDVLRLITSLRDLLAKNTKEPELFAINVEDNTVRDRKTGNVIAACGDQYTAALVSIVLSRFEEVSSQPDRLPFPAWKGPYVS